MCFWIPIPCSKAGLLLSYLLLLASVLATVCGFCMISPGTANVTVTGKVRNICTHNGVDYLEGSKFRTAECMECECRQKHMSCCGFGIKVGTISPPTGCKVIADGCEPLIVTIANETIDCLSGLPIGQNSAFSHINFRQQMTKSGMPGFPNFNDFLRRQTMQTMRRQPMQTFNQFPSGRSGMNVDSVFRTHPTIRMSNQIPANNPSANQVTHHEWSRVSQDQPIGDTQQLRDYLAQLMNMIKV